MFSFFNAKGRLQDGKNASECKKTVFVIQATDWNMAMELCVPS